MSFDSDYFEYESNRQNYRNIVARHASESWQVRMYRVGELKYIGQYESLSDAVIARDNANKIHKRVRRERKLRN